MEYTFVVEFYIADDGWRWRAVHHNGNVLADSGEAYKRRVDCVSTAALLMGDIEPSWERLAPKRGEFSVTL